MSTSTASLRPEVTKNYQSGAPREGRAWRPGAGTWWAAVGVTLLAGYWDLVRGGITVGPFLLVAAYCALVPAAIWSGRPSTRPARHPPIGRAEYLAATVAALAVLALYVVTLAPTTSLWDTSEYIAAAYTAGIPHPPGNPLFVLLGRVFALLPIAPTVAMRVNLLAAVCSAAAAGFWFLATERILRDWLPARWQRMLGASAAVLIGATAFTVWNQSVVNEKVYTISLLGIAATSWLLVRWLEAPDSAAADTLLVLAAYLTGLGFANQMSAFLVGPAAVAAVVARRPRTLLRWRLLIACAVALAGGMTVFATQPIRSAFNPPINEGEPTACAHLREFRLDCTLTATTWERFKYNFNREQYGKPPLTVRQAPFTAQVGMWWLYFKWQWLRDPYLEQGALQSLLAATFLVLGLYGGALHFRRDRHTFWFFATLTATLSVLLAFYMNFRYGASQAPGLGDSVSREVRDRDYFYIWSFSAWGVWAALGLVGVWEALASTLRGRATGRAWLRSTPVLLLALVPLVANSRTAPRSGETAARDFAHDLLNSVEPYGILVTAGDNDTFPLWYAQEVEGVRRDVLVVINELLNTDWHLRQALRRPVEPYDAAKGPAIYRDRGWARPAGPVIRMTELEADSLPYLQPVTGRMAFRKEGLEAIIDPANLIRDEQGTGYLTRADVAVLRMLADSWPARPFYFAQTSVSQARKLGLEPYLLTQGLARKLVPAMPTASRDTLPTDRGWFDVERTGTLWRDVYRGPEALAARPGWIDRPSSNIPYLYAVVGHELAYAQHAIGMRARADSTMAVARAVAESARLDEALPALSLPE